MNKKAGFTLIELLIVIVIIIILSAIVTQEILQLRVNAKAGKLVNDYKMIKSAWELWLNDVDSLLLPNQDDFSQANSLPCHDEPAISDTDLFSNVHNYSGWAGPYIPVKPLTPWGVEYTYDNDGDTWPEDGYHSGVNLTAQWCDSRRGNQALEIAPLIDEHFDNGDGRTEGRVRWSSGSSSGTLRILLAPKGD